jgi:hypothetical protein
MKCKYFVISNNKLVSSVLIDSSKVVIKTEDKEQTLDVTSKVCFNTLVSLFSLKDSWSHVSCKEPIYQIEFDDNKGKDVYTFDINCIPSNFSMFLGYISKLVGDNL